MQSTNCSRRRRSWCRGRCPPRPGGTLVGGNGLEPGAAERPLQVYPALLTYLVVPRTVTDRSGYYMPADRPSSQTDLVATAGAKPLKQRKRPESYLKPAHKSSES